MLHGASAEQLRAWSLGRPEDYHYLNTSGMIKECRHPSPSPSPSPSQLGVLPDFSLSVRSMPTWGAG